MENVNILLKSFRKVMVEGKSEEQGELYFGALLMVSKRARKDRTFSCHMREWPQSET